LNNLLLAIYSRIFVGCYSFLKRFKQSILIVQGVHFVFALFNLQGTSLCR